MFQQLIDPFQLMALTISQNLSLMAQLKSAGLQSSPILKPIPIKDSEQKCFTKTQVIEFRKAETKLSLTNHQEDKIQKKWDDDCDRCLREIALQYRHDWKKISSRIHHLKGLKKSATFLKNRLRTLKNLSENFNQKFSHEEDLRLVLAIKKHGKDWASILSYFPKRDSISLRNRFYYKIAKNNCYQNLLEEAENISVEL